jgi:hypothetical protein
MARYRGGRQVIAGSVISAFSYRFLLPLSGIGETNMARGIIAFSVGELPDGLVP